MEAIGFYNDNMHFKNYAIQCYKIARRGKLKPFCIQKYALISRILNFIRMENIMQNISQLLIFLIYNLSTLLLCHHEGAKFEIFPKCLDLCWMVSYNFNSF